ncbi:MAG: glycoside hydrolase family 26 protein [Prevotellaceae bacterium]|jgi:hypothetical protein|nr:glycoside hydrolase family 26 protein [Prevotellaceae bacterium]
MYKLLIFAINTLFLYSCAENSVENFVKINGKSIEITGKLHYFGRINQWYEAILTSHRQEMNRANILGDNTLKEPSLNYALEADFHPIDKHATTETKAMYSRLKELAKRGIMFGHQDDLAYGHDWFREAGRSDVKDVCGDYTAVVGWELGHIEIAATYNLDSINFDDMKQYILQAHRRGSFNTISWHCDNIITGNTAWDCRQNTVVKSILPGGDNHNKYKTWLDRLAAFLSDLKDDEGRPLPVMFRMYHEHTGDWFWWCSKQCTPEEYIALWRMTLEYLRDVKQIHNLIYVYSPSDVNDVKEYLERYPGDDFVDMLGFDCYAAADKMSWYEERMKNNLDIITRYANEVNKIACLSETGLEGIVDTAYFTDTLYPLIENYEISYLLLWRNAWQMKTHFYVPFAGHSSSDNFRRFIQFPRILMCKNIK